MILSNKTKGILCIIVAAVGFALMSAFVKLSGDIPFTQKMFFRNFVAFLVSGVILLKNNGTYFNKKNMSLYFARGIMGTLGMICTFYSIDRLLLADATMLFKLAPFFAILMSFVILRERIDLVRIFIILGAFIGSVFIINPSFESLSLNFPFFIAIGAAFFAGIAYTFVRKLGQRGASGASIVFFFSAFSTAVAIPLFFLTYEPMTLFQVCILCFAGLAATLGQFAVTRAYMYAPAREISVFDYSQILFATLLGFFLYGEVPSSYSFIGYVIIISMGIISFVYSKDSKKAVNDVK